MVAGEGESTRKVLDAWAVIAWLRDEPASAGLVDSLLQKAKARKVQLFLSVLNLGEIFYVTSKTRGLPAAEMVLEELAGLPIEVRAAPNALVMEAARLKSLYPISYADAFAAATAIREGARLVTGDPEMKVLSARGVLQLDWISGRRLSE